MTARIFVSYRRDDTGGHAGRLAEALQKEYGPSDVFLDHEQIEAGEAFPTELEEAINAASLMIVLMGKRFVAPDPKTGKSRLHNSSDWVRIEINRALNRNLQILPIVTQSAGLPRREDLPRFMAQILKIEAFEIADRDWKLKLDPLIALIDRILARQAVAITRANAGRLTLRWSAEADPDTTLAFSHDSRLLVFGDRKNEGVARLASVHCGDVLGSVKVSNDTIQKFAVSPGGDGLAVASADAQIAIWEWRGNSLQSPELLEPDSLADDTKAIAFSRDGDYFAAGTGSRSVKLWRVKNWNKMFRLEAGWLSQFRRGNIGYPTSIDFSPDGELAAFTIDHEIQIWRFAEQRLLRTLEGHGALVTSAAFAPHDPRILLSASHDQTLKLWAVSTGQANQTWTQHDDEVVHACFSPDGLLVFSGSSDGSICLSDLAGAVVHTVPGRSPVRYFAISPNGEFLAILRAEKRVEVWKTDSAATSPPARSETARPSRRRST